MLMTPASIQVTTSSYAVSKSISPAVRSKLYPEDAMVVSGTIRGCCMQVEQKMTGRAEKKVFSIAAMLDHCEGSNGCADDTPRSHNNA